MHAHMVMQAVAGKRSGMTVMACACTAGRSATLEAERCTHTCLCTNMLLGRCSWDGCHVQLIRHSAHPGAVSAVGEMAASACAYQHEAGGWTLVTTYLLAMLVYLAAFKYHSVQHAAAI